MEKSAKKKQNIAGWLTFLGAVLIIAAVCFLVVFLTGGQTTITSGQSEKIKSTTLSCETIEKTYEFFEYDKSESKKLSMSVLFDGDELRSVSLKYTLNYNDEREVKDSEAINHNALSTAFGKDGLDEEALGNAYSMQSDRLVLSLYVAGDDFTSTTAKYFLASGLSKKSSLANFEKNYEKQGFSCTIDE